MSGNRRRLAAIAMLGVMLMPLQAAAHSGGTSYLSLTRVDSALQGELDLPLPDAASELALDADGDAALRWGEVLDAAPRIETQLAKRLRLTSDAGSCGGRLVAAPALVRRDNGPHLRLALRFDCSATATAGVALDVTPWLAAVPDHGVLVQMREGAGDSAGGNGNGSGMVSLLASSVTRLPLAWHGVRTDSGRMTADSMATDTTMAKAMVVARNAGRFLRLGIEHMLTGYDHLAFLALLLLGALRGAGASLRATGIAVLRVVTAFTLAHSVTLALAAIGILRLPSALVEAAIAASILATALGLLLRRSWVPHWRLAFGIGLVHGLGFAGLLGELLDGRNLALPLAAFNLGLELAQLAVVLLALPLLVWMARRPALQARLVPALTLGLAGCGLAWLVQRL